MYGLYKDTDVLTHIKLRRLEWAGHMQDGYIKGTTGKIGRKNSW